MPTTFAELGLRGLTDEEKLALVGDLWDEFLEAGLTGFNMQINCVGIDTVEQRLKGRMCLIADVDRQGVVPFGAPREAYAHVAEIVTRLGSPLGGLVLRVDIYPDVPLANIEAVLSTIGSWKDDPLVEAELEEIYRRRREDLVEDIK